MRFLICLCIMSIACLVSAQQGYNITYKLMVEEFPDLSGLSERNSRPGTNYNRLVCNDSVSFAYGMPGRKDPMKESKAYGSKVFHHSLVFYPFSRHCLRGVAYQLPEKKRHFIFDSARIENWILEDSLKTILGYQCRKAFIATRKWIKVDTTYKSYIDITTAWYAEDIKLPFGPLQYYGLPGLVLEVYDQRYMGRHITAIEIKKEPVSIIVPANINIISAEDVRKRRN